MNQENETARSVDLSVTEKSGHHDDAPPTHESVSQTLSTPSTDNVKQRLKTRARALARNGEKEKSVGESIEVVEFLLAYERYGIESSYIREIHPLRELTAVPCTPPFVLGIINVRGEIVSVIDMKKFFDLPERGLTDMNKVIIVHDDRMEFGILADAILGVRSILREEIQPSPPTLTGIRAEYLQGVTREPLVVLDAAKMLSAKNLVVHDEMEI
jgi:purine-binding chemotaxis protein CheW